MAAQAYGPSALATPANAITLARVAATPFLVVMILSRGPAWNLFAAWVVLAATDVLDGWLARRHGATRSGAFLDPLADKVVVLAAMAALVSIGRIWWAPVAVIGARELAISAYRSYVGRRGVSVPARGLAKAKTWVQVIAVGMALVPATGAAYGDLLAGVLWAAVAITVVTGAQYLLDGRHVVRAV
ncbi:MAG TPA: CDP-alcohol phosphatidyltransferase family protein [Acidimicrobiales bacterium]|nr:CDP-alcohol phosphatidyltransferase family protein [Acidimicrobiales bacterium]